MEKQPIIVKNWLFGHVSAETAKEVTDYPWGYKLRTSQFYWVETTKHGDRFCHYTIDPRNGRKCAPKKTTYNTVGFMYENEEGHIKFRPFSFNCLLSELREKLTFFMQSIPAEQVSELQRKNVVTEIVNVVAISVAYAARKYAPERVPLIREWGKNAVKYFTTCNFVDIAAFPEIPEPDFKD